MKPIRFKAKDLRCPNYFFQYCPTGDRFGDHYIHPEIRLYRVFTDTYGGRFQVDSKQIASFVWQSHIAERSEDKPAPGSAYVRPYGFCARIESDGLGGKSFIAFCRIIRAIGDYVGFSTHPKEVLRAMKRCHIPRWDHAKTGRSEFDTTPVPHKYRACAAAYDDARALVAC